MHVSNWGNYPTIQGEIHSLRNFDPCESIPWIPRGMGRSYGDASLGRHMVDTCPNNRLLYFDDQTGVLHCESGVTFEDILNVFLPQGWFPPVTPGTKYVTLGGALAADVHGKNHHLAGAISQYVSGIELQLPSGEVLYCSPQKDEHIFWATMGGMGLTGLIRTVWIKLIPVDSRLIQTKTIKAKNLDEILDLFEAYKNVSYSVAWIDCLASGKRSGRSLLMLGEHATHKDIRKVDYLKIKEKSALPIPLNFPSKTLNPFSIKAFNTLYYHKQFAKDTSKIVGYDSFFYPLDSLQNWNRIYGKKGFVQYQCVIPKEVGKKGMKEIIRRINERKMGSFLAVLKLMGPNPHTEFLSFPMEGYTLALDFPVNKSLFAFLHLMDKFVMGMGGRVYLAKDARLRPDACHQMYPGLDNFRRVLREIGNTGQISSFLAERLQIFE